MELVEFRPAIERLLNRLERDVVAVGEIQVLHFGATLREFRESRIRHNFAIGQLQGMNRAARACNRKQSFVRYGSLFETEYFQRRTAFGQANERAVGDFLAR